MSHLTIFNQSNYKPQFQNAYEYLNNVKLEIRGLKSAIELEVNDIVCVVGISEPRPRQPRSRYPHGFPRRAGSAA